MKRPCDSVFEAVQAAPKWMADRDESCDAVSEGLNAARNWMADQGMKELSPEEQRRAEVYARMRAKIEIVKKRLQAENDAQAEKALDAEESAVQAERHAQMRSMVDRQMRRLEAERAAQAEKAAQGHQKKHQ